MKRITKSLLTGVLALGLIAPVATSTLNVNPIQTTVSARHRSRRAYYRKGMPTALVPRNKKYQLNKLVHGKNKGIRVFMSKKGIEELYPGGNGSGASVGIHPKYHYYGHGAYRIKANGENFVIKKHRGNRYSVWDLGQYVGYCFRKYYKY